MPPTDLDIEALRSVLSGRLIGHAVLYHETLDSTMDEARRLADDGAPEGTVVIAEKQSGGRGRFDRAWVSPPGSGLLLSVVLRPKTPQLPYANMAATLAVSEAIMQLTGLRPTIKWPNDVRLGGRKVSGILIESAMSIRKVAHAVAGIGLNANLDESEISQIGMAATSIRVEAGRPVDRTTLAQALLESFDDLYKAVRLGRSLTSRWAEQLDTLGQHVQVRRGDQLLAGLARDVDEQGNLLLTVSDGSSVTVVAGEVTLQTPPPV